MPISVINTSGGSTPPPVAPATTTQIENQLFTVIAETGPISNTVAGAAGEYKIGDNLERVVIYDGVTVSSEVWTNLTTNATLSVAPVGADLAQQSSVGLTDAELRAAAVDVFVVNPTDAAGLEPGADTTTYSEQYEAILPDTVGTPAQWSEGDIITREAVVNTATDPDTITYNYYNETTGLPIDTTAPNVAPTPDQLTQIVQQALTDAELRAAPVEVFVTNQPQPGPTPTENQTSVSQYEALTTDGNTPPQWSTGDTLTYTTTYDYSTEPPTLLSEEWFNQTTGLPIDTSGTPFVAPTAADITALPQGVVAPSVERAISIDRASADAAYAVAGGATQIDIYVETGFVIILGQVFTAGYSFSWAIDNPGETLGALPIDTTNGTALVSVIR